MEFEDDVYLYGEIDEVIKEQLNKPRIHTLLTELPSLDEQKTEIFSRRRLKKKFEERITNSNFVSPPTRYPFVDFAMKQYIRNEYPSDDNDELEYIVEKYVGKPSSDIPNQFDFVISGREKKSNEELKNTRLSFDENTVSHVMEHARRAVRDLKSYEDRKESDVLIAEPTFLILSIELYGYSTFTERFTVKLPHPFNFLEDSQICFIYEDKNDLEKLRNQLDDVRFNYECLYVEDLEEYEKDEEKLRLFLDSYDFVVVDKNLKFILYDYGVSDHLMNEKKLVLSRKKEMVSDAELNLLSSILTTTKYCNFTSISVGLVDMEESELMKNVEANVRFILQIFDERKLRSLYLSTKESPRLYLFKNYVVQEPPQRIQEKEERV